jgi:hypothetical protein
MARNLRYDELNGTYWLGEVVDINDPNKVGRIKVKVFGKFDLIPTEDIPWAYPTNAYTGGDIDGGGSFSVPKKGSIVSVTFDSGNIYHPEYKFIQNISKALKDEISNSYENAHSVIYDTVTEGGVKVFFTEEKGLMFDFKSTQVNIKPDKSVKIQTESGKSIIEITNDGKLTITQDGNITIKTNANIDINCVNATVKSTKTFIKAGYIELGDGASENLVLGKTFLPYFNSHIHMTPAGPSLTPMVPMSNAMLSKNTYTR